MNKCSFFHKWSPWGGDWITTLESGETVVMVQRTCARCGKVQTKVKFKLS